MAKIYKIHGSIFRRIITSIIFLFFGLSLFCQNQKLADSLETIYVNGEFEEEDRLQLLKDLAAEHPVNETKIKYANKLLALAKEKDSNNYIYVAYLEKGNAFDALGEMSEAIKNFLKAGDIAIINKDSMELGAVYGSIANVYQNMGNLKSSVYYHNKSINIFKNNMLIRKDTLKLASSIMNLGFLYKDQQKLDSAFIYFNESEELFRQINDSIGLAYNQLNKGSIYAEQKDFINAESSINNAFPIIEKYGHFEAMCETLIEISEIYLVKNEIERATEFAHKGLKLAKEHNLKPEISEANLQLSRIYEKYEGENQSLIYFKNHIAYRDSVTNLSSIQEIGNMRTEFEVARKQAEVNLLNEQKTNQRVLIFSMIAILGMTGLYFRNINKEKRRSDELLLNILPSKTADELKEHGKVKAKKFDSVTVMFTDFQAFTRYSQKLSPEVLVKSVDYFFSKFDEIIGTYDLEKIKTIGDAYMCAGGLASDSKDHIINVIHAAFEIKAFIEETKRQPNDDIVHFNIRIGINTGAVVAGVVGKKKFAYDIWGDTVNVASRMESNSDAGKINVSENTYQLIKDHFHCEYRGEIDVKNKGMMKMYFVVQPKKNGQIPVYDESLKVLC